MNNKLSKIINISSFYSDFLRILTTNTTSHHLSAYWTNYFHPFWVIHAGPFPCGFHSSCTALTVFSSHLIIFPTHYTLCPLIKHVNIPVNNICWIFLYHFPITSSKIGLHFILYVINFNKKNIYIVKVIIVIKKIVFKQKCRSCW